MSDIQIGQKVHNFRTGAEGKVLDIVERWTGRHTTRKLKVETIHGDVKEWSFSTCKVVEEAAPRSLVLLKGLIEGAYKHKEAIIEKTEKEFNNSRGFYAIITNCDTFSSFLKNAESLRKLSVANFGLLITFICLERNLDRITASYGGGVVALTSELINIYGDRKVK